eukprot:3134715-Pleurochrysis_carterae.AAC.2
MARRRVVEWLNGRAGWQARAEGGGSRGRLWRSTDRNGQADGAAVNSDGFWLRHRDWGVKT